MTRSLDDVRALRRRFGVTPNDVVLATCAGALRRFAERRGETPQGLKVMVPADVRGAQDAEGGNRISFVFFELPCDEPDPVVRLRGRPSRDVAAPRDGAAEDVDAAFRVLALTPGPVQRALAHAFAHPRMSNLTISSVPGPAVPRYMLGCRLREVHSAVPLSERHALSIGVVTVAGSACFGIYADAETLPDADALRERSRRGVRRAARRLSQFGSSSSRRRRVAADRLAVLRARLVAALPVVLRTAERLAGGLVAGRAQGRVGAHGLTPFTEWTTRSTSPRSSACSTAPSALGSSGRSTTTSSPS